MLGCRGTCTKALTPTVDDGAFLICPVLYLQMYSFFSQHGLCKHQTRSELRHGHTAPSALSWELFRYCCSKYIVRQEEDAKAVNQIAAATYTLFSTPSNSPLHLK